jgi:TonB-dependent receptor
VDATLPKDLFGERESELKFGLAVDKADRVVNGRTIFFDERAVQAGDPNSLYESFLSPGVSKLFDSPVEVDATREVQAAYLGTNLSFTSWFRVVGGARYEAAEFATSGWARWNQLTTNNLYDHPEYGRILGTRDLPGVSTNVDLLTPVVVQGTYAKDEVLPAFGIVLEPNKKFTTRLAYSETRGRPSLRELSPFFNKSLETGNVVVGNPGLIASEVNSYDLRLEYNPMPDQGVAVSFFYKEIENPIEKVALQTTEVGTLDTWVNNPSVAELRGLEFEFRHGLGIWTEALYEFSLNGNFTYIDAQVDENPFVLEVLSNVPTSRRLFDQPEYIANMDVTWRREKWGTSATFAAYAIGDVLQTAGLSSELGPGGDARPDLYTRAYTRFDLVLTQRLSEHVKLKFSVKNLFDPELGTIYDRERHGRLVEYNTYRIGRTFSFSISGEF